MLVTGPLDADHSEVGVGDWAGLPRLLKTEGLLGTYDIVLSAETVYSLDSQQQLLNCIRQVLFLAAMTPFTCRTHQVMYRGL